MGADSPQGRHSRKDWKLIYELIAWLIPLRRDRAKYAMFAALVVPVQSSQFWEQEKYSHIPPNKVSFSRDGILVQIDKSASPLIYALDSPRKVIGFHIRGEFRGLPKFQDVHRQGQKGFDDYALRVGFVVPGKKRLSGLKKMFAPAWVAHLYLKVPDSQGLSHIQFFNATQNQSQVGTERIHPSSELIHESFFAHIERDGKFDYAYTLPAPLDASALWISIDGDDTQSIFDVLISALEISLK